LAKHIRFQADYDDGATDAFAVPEATLQQGGVPAVLRIVAWVWQTIVSVRSKRFVLN
jgi:hypothetical protein